MIYSQTYLNVADNTGAQKVMCIKILGNNRKCAKIGDVLIGVVKKCLVNSTIKRSQIIKAVVVRTKCGVNRLNGMKIKFDENAVVLLGTENNPKGTRIFGPIPRELKSYNFLKIISLAKTII